MPPPPPQPQPQPPPSPPLPTPRAFLTSLLQTFSTLPPTTLSNNPPSTAAKSPLLTLHALFPSTLLPALDLLDRHLITKLIYDPETSAAHDTAAGGVREYDTDAVLQSARKGEEAFGGKRVVYYVKSAAGGQREGRARYGVGATCYEVRTRGWSCSCAAFAFAAFNEGRGDDECGGYGAGMGDGEEMLLDVEEGGEGLEELEERGDRGWGGLMGEGNVPLCKHLFACVIAEHWEVAGDMVEEREVGREEMAGWAAGWGG